MEITLEAATTAMCVWEELLDRSSKGVTDIYSKKRDAVGACEMRGLVILNLVPAIELAWLTVGEQFDESFDWEFIPRFLDLAIPVLEQVSYGGSWIMHEHDAIEIGRAVVATGHEQSVDS